MRKRKQIKKKILKTAIPITSALILLIILFLGYQKITGSSIKEKEFLETIETNTYATIDNYVIYGIHLRLEGKITLENQVENIKLVLSNGKTELEIPWILEQVENTYNFKTSKNNNEGINLEKLPEEDLYLLIKTETKEEEKTTTKYYSVENKSIYKNLEYYTLTKNHKNNKINIEWNTYENCPTLRFKIKETTLPENVYDITIDPGHDVTDPGKTVCFNGSNIIDPDWYGNCEFGSLYKESDMNLYVSQKIKEKLEEVGYKVTMTRNTEQDRVKVYDKMGSATMANDTKSKFSFAIHHNSSGINGGISYLKGLELYVANDINFDLANYFIEEIMASASTVTSSKTQHLSENGIYQRFFTEKEILEDDVQPSNKTTNNIWYYYIREVGGVSTGATNDGRYAPTYPKNEHQKSNNTAEPYLFELGYMDNVSDLNNIINNKENYATGFVRALQKYLEQE